MINIIKNNKFETFLVIILLALFSFKISNNTEESTQILPNTVEQNGIYVFYHPSCPHCHKAIDFIDSKLKDKYKNIIFYKINITTEKNSKLFKQYGMEYGLDIEKMGVPTIFIGDKYMIGYGTDETSGVELEILVDDFSNQNSIKTHKDTKELIINENSTSTSDLKPEEKSKILDLPFFGKIDVFKTSLPVLSVILGFVDGFNPCAMWVLAYLISLVAGLKDRKKMWKIVGAFVLAEGIMYYLFMTTWLNLFLFLGYIYYITVFVGIVGLYTGITSIKAFIETRGGALVCNVGDAETKKKTMSKMERLVQSELKGIAGFLSILCLAFVVNSIEFMCSAAIPAVYTSVLANANISSFMHYFYLLIYNIFYMLDDYIIFGMALFAINKYLGDSYARWCKLIGGIILLGLGIMMVFYPYLLR